MSEGHDANKFIQNMNLVATKYQQIMMDLLNKDYSNAPKYLEPAAMIVPFTDLWQSIITKPENLFKYQMEYFQKYQEILGNVAARFAGDKIGPVYSPTSRDNRFKSEAWDENIAYDFLRQTYFMTSEWLQHIILDQDNLDENSKKKASFYTKQIVDAMAPSNFILTNPEVLKETLATNGENLIKGLVNLEEDIRNNKISTVNKDSFKLGETLATTEGQIVYRNELMELIWYKPKTERQNEIPLLIMPPWINKYYILDLKPENSYVKWILEQGISVFMISWKNPDKSSKDIDFEDYMKFGPLEAIEQMKQICGSKKVNVVGYCLGGTLLACLLSYYKKKNIDNINSATFLTTLLDFAHAGDLSLFTTEKDIDVLEKHISEVGVFSGEVMSRTFSMLRANEMIWSFIVNNYLLGKEPFPFDLLYWNDDSTNMPARMHVFYLKNMYQKNSLIKPNELKLLGEGIDLGDVTVPCYFLSCLEDHIAPWENTYRSAQLLKNAKSLKYVLSGSGHVAGVVNPPSKQKYYYHVSGDFFKNSSNWFPTSTRNEGSWWGDWLFFLKEYSGKEIKSLQIDAKKFDKLPKAPGDYVKVKI